MTKLEKLIAKQRKILDRIDVSNDKWYENPQDVCWVDELDMRWISRCKRAGTLIDGHDKRFTRSDIDKDWYDSTKVCEYCEMPEEECACDECRFCDWCDKPHHSLGKRSYCQCSELEYIQDEIEALEESK
mgnify:CR=1 FL=1